MTIDKTMILQLMRKKKHLLPTLLFLGLLKNLHTYLAGAGIAQTV
jgi:hypothetical protein